MKFHVNGQQLETKYAEEPIQVRVFLGAEGKTGGIASVIIRPDANDPNQVTVTIEGHCAALMFRQFNGIHLEATVTHTPTEKPAQLS